MEKRLPLPAGTVLQDRYRIVQQLGAGGMGAVYEAVDDDLKLSFALKETFYAADEEMRDAFKREARMLASLSHEAFPRVTHYFTEGDGCFLVMELVLGDDLKDLLANRAAPFPPEQVLAWADQLLDALEDLHADGIIHRDIKPANLKLTPKGKIKLLDFGIAKGTLEGETTLLTTIGSLAAATVQYAPLEQVLKASEQYQAMLSVISADKVLEIMKRGTDATSDLYALAATLYQLLTKRLPIDALTRALSVWSGKADPLLPAHQINPQVNRKVSAILHQAMSLERTGRYQSAAEMRRRLKETEKPSPPINPTPTVPLAAPPVQSYPAPAATAEIRHRAKDAQPNKTLTGHSEEVFSVAFAPDGQTLASGSEDKTIKLWDIARGKLTQTLTGHSEGVLSVAFAPDGKTLASGSRDNTIKLWDTASGTLIQTLTGHKVVWSVAFSPDGKTLASGSDDKTIKLWRVE